jgi:Tol biopolymer transport system component
MNVVRGSLASLAVLATSLGMTATAGAEFGPIRLVSKSPTEQAQEASATALSADGRFIAFQGTIGALRGVFREELGSGDLVPVAAGSAYEAGAEGADAVAPSISADGRYVSFSTRARLDPVDDTQPNSSDVYVADMSSAPPTYELASALDGSSHGLTYSGSGGSQASGRVALSGDGREVVFVTTATSDLTSGPGGSTEGTPTPAGQVVLRDLAADRTTLVSARRDPETGEMSDPALPVTGGAVIQQPSLPRLKGAALSADGTTVAWLGAHLPAQVPLLVDEAQKISERDNVNAYPYDEPLWRRVADGQQAPSRRIVGGGDPLAPGCPPDGTLADPSCQGPFPGITAKDENLNSASGWLGVNVNGVPQLSGDGRMVALIGNPSEATNVFLVDMSDGLSRREAVRQLTREISVDPENPAGVINLPKYLALNGHIFDLGISATGLRIGLATARQQFPLAPPNLASPPPASLGLVELYLIDRDGETLRRITHGVAGAATASSGAGSAQLSAQNGDGANSPSFDDDGRLIAFASSASNLVEGDGNDASDAFLVEDEQASRVPGAVEISPAPGAIRPRRRWPFTVSAFSLPSGAVQLVALVPGTGALRARAWGSLKAGAPPRSLARGRRSARGDGGRVRLTLKLPGRLRRLAHTQEGVYGIARVSFHRNGERTLRGALQVRFHAHPAKHRGRR